MADVSNVFSEKLRRILYFKLSRNERQGSDFFYGSGFYEMFLAAFLNNGVFIVRRVGFELTILHEEREKSAKRFIYCTFLE